MGRRSRRKVATDQQKIEFISYHLPYEIGMLFWAYCKLTGHIADGNERNSVIETFCLHARNLIEFFENRPACGLDPRWFAPRYSPSRVVKPYLVDRLNNQITHLSPSRTSIAEQKIGREDRQLMFSGIADRLKFFLAHLEEPYRGMWPTAAHPDAFAPNAALPTTTTAPLLVSSPLPPKTDLLDL